MNVPFGTKSTPTVAILAGGLATRMRPMTDLVPKSLLEVAGEPFLAHQLRWLAEQGLRRVVLCSGHLSDQIHHFAGDGWRFGLSLTYSSDGAHALGTGGAIRHALPLLGEHFIVMYGDSLLTAPIMPIWNRFCASHALAMMTVYRNEGRWDSSNVQIGGDRVVRYDKQGHGMSHIDYGLSVFSAESFAAVPDGLGFDLSRIFQDLIRQGSLGCFEVHQRFYEIGSLQGWTETDLWLRTAKALAAGDIG